MKSRQEIILIAAMAENRVIGKDNAMPFTVKGNLARFKELTMGFPCIMGRKTWESLPKKPLPGRLNIIISKTLKNNNEALVFASLQSAIEHCAEYEKIFVIGGESIYKQALPLANRIDLTLVTGQYEGDAFFPEIDDNWEKTDTIKFNYFSVINYVKIKQE